MDASEGEPDCNPFSDFSHFVSPSVAAEEILEVVPPPEPSVTAEEIFAVIEPPTAYAIPLDLGAGDDDVDLRPELIGVPKNPARKELAKSGGKRKSRGGPKRRTDFDTSDENEPSKSLYESAESEDDNESRSDPETEDDVEMPLTCDVGPLGRKALYDPEIVNTNERIMRIRYRPEESMRFDAYFTGHDKGILNASQMPRKVIRGAHNLINDDFACETSNYLLVSWNINYALGPPTKIVLTVSE